MTETTAKGPWCADAVWPEAVRIFSIAVEPILSAGLEALARRQ